MKIVLILILSTFIFVGCVKSSATSETPAQGATKQISQAFKNGNPVRVAMLIDATGSMQNARTDRPKIEDLEPLFSLCREAGCEIAVDIITQSSNRGMVRLLVFPPPVAPIPPDEKMNPYDRAEKLVKHNELMSEYEKNKATPWKKHTETEITKFKNAIQPLLQHPANSPMTNLYDAIRRADTAVGEPDDVFGKPTHRYIIVISDAVHNAASGKPSLISGAKLILVNGVVENSLKELSPLRFESVTTAILWVVAKERETVIKDDLSPPDERSK